MWQIEQGIGGWVDEPLMYCLSLLVL